MIFKQAMNPKENLRSYEQVLVLHPDSSEQEQKNVCLMSADIIKKQKGKLFRVDTWGSRPLGNPKAKKVSRGLYFYMLFSATPEIISEIRKQLSINSKVLYFHQEKLSKKESPEDRIENFFQNLEQTKEKEKERMAKIQKKQSFTRPPLNS